MTTESKPIKQTLYEKASPSLKQHLFNVWDECYARWSRPRRSAIESSIQ